MRVLVTSGLVSAAVAAVVSLTITQAWSAVSRAVVAFWHFLRADHQTIRDGHLAGVHTGDFSVQIACIVRVAPSRRWRNFKPMNVSAVLELGQKLADALAPGAGSTAEVVRSISQLVEVRAAPLASGTLGTSHNLVDIISWPSGLVEIAVPITDAPIPSGNRAVTTSELQDFIPSVRFQRASSAILTINRSLARALPRIYSTGGRGRLDWSIRITGSVSVNQSGSIAWQGIGFTSPTAMLSRAKEARPTAGDLSAKALFSRPRDEKPEAICELALLAWVQESGYWADETDLKSLIRQEMGA